MEILAYAVGWMAQTVILFVALWIMVTLQKLEYTVLALLGTAALGLDMIPYAGHYIAVPVLYICIARVTRADLFPDAVFTVVVAYALMFCANLFLIGSLMGDLRPSVRYAEPTEASATNREATALEAGTNSLSPTNPVAASAPKTNAVPVPHTNNATLAKPKAAMVTNAAKPLENFATTFSVKGISQGPRSSLASISTGVKTYTISVGETMSMETAKKKVEVRCEAVNEDSVVLDIAGQRVTLPFQ